MKITSQRALQGPQKVCTLTPRRGEGFQISLPGYLAVIQLTKLSLNLGISDISISPSSYSCNLTHIKALELFRKMYFQMKLINQEGVIISDPGESLILGLVFHVISMICLHRAFVSHTWLEIQWTVGVGDRGRPEVPSSDKNKLTKRWGSLVFSRKRNGFDKTFSAVTNMNW